MNISRRYFAVPEYVHKSGRIDVLMDLGFDTFRKHTVVLADVVIPDALVDLSVACLIRLILKKSVVIETQNDEDRNCAVNLYVSGNVPVAACAVSINGDDFVWINSYVRWLASQPNPFSIDLIRSHLRGSTEILKR